MEQATIRRLVLAAALLPAAADAQFRGPQQFGLRSGETAGFSDRADITNQELFVRSPARNWSGKSWYPDYGQLELAISRFETLDDTASATLFGPVFGWGLPVRGMAFEFGIRPTWFSDPVIGELDMGGRFHFTSHLGLAWRFTRELNATLRVQHTSNGGVDDDNPGLDMQMVELGYRF